MTTQSVKPQGRGVSAGLHARRILAYAVLGVLCFLCLFFFYVLAVNATHNHYEILKGFNLLPGADFSKNLAATLADSSLPVLRGIVNSLLIASLSALLAIYFSALTAYGIYAYDFKLKNLAFTFIILIMSMPTQISALGFVRLIGRMGGTNRLWPLILPSIASPTVFYFMIQYMKSSLPMEIVEAARIDGCSEFGTFNRVVLPLLKPAMAVQAIFSFVASWNNYFTPALILDSKSNPTLPILIATLRSKDVASLDMGSVYMLIAVAILPVIVVYLLLSKFIVAGVTLGGVKG
ncbi:MAG: carbohydrate ABC transporter permease [Clostridia bacterium]|nr:carbohydrate ABC transporter permease [Clostridia bacterium]